MSDVQRVTAAQGWRMVVRRFAALLAGEGAARVVGFVTVLLLARRLGPTGFGIITLGLTLVAWFSQVVDSGTEILSVREIARRPSRLRPIAEQMLGLRIALSIIAAIGFVAAVSVFARSEFTRETLVLFALMLPATALNLRWMVLGVGGSRAIAAGQVFARLVVLGGVLLFVANATDLRRVPVLETLAALVYGAAVLWLVPGLRGIVPRTDFAVWGSTLRQSAPLMVTGLTRSATISFDILVIDLALGPRDVGIYGVASKPALFVTGAVGLFSLAFLSAFSATADEEAPSLQGKAVRRALRMSIVVAVIVCLTAPLIPFVFGAEYQRAVGVLLVIAWRIPPAVVAGIYGSVLVARDRQAAVMRNSIAVAAFVICTDLLAVPLFGLLGAAVVSVFAAGLTLLLNYRSVRRAAPELVGDPLDAEEPSSP